MTAPATAWPAIVERLRAGDVVLIPLPGTGAAPRRLPRAVAVGVLFLVVASAVAALVNRNIIHDVFRRFIEQPASSGPQPAATSVVSADAFTELVVLPEHDAIAVHLEAPAPDLRLRVRLSDGPGLGVRALRGAAAARFQSGPGRIGIAQAGAGEIVLEVPRRLPVFRIEVDGRVWLSKQGSRLNLHRAVVDTIDGEFIIPVR